jgi:hypothetical protein
MHFYNYSRERGGILPESRSSSRGESFFGSYSADFTPGFRLQTSSSDFSFRPTSPGAFLAATLPVLRPVFRFQTSDQPHRALFAPGFQISDFRLQTSDFRL